MKTSLKILLGVVIVAGAAAGYYILRRPQAIGRSAMVLSYLRDPQGHPEWQIQAGQRCGNAPFILPTNGMIGYLWDDSFRPGHRHQGIDIFGGAQAGQTLVVAASDGYLTRPGDWKSSVIIRIPKDPLHPGQQIWTYYTHMADVQGNSFIAKEFPAGTQEVFVRAGTPLGHQGNYSGDPLSPTGVHLHFSIVLDDGKGKFLNELQIENTLDPSPYLGLPLNGKTSPDNQASVCH